MHFVISEGKLLNELRKTSAVRANRSLLISSWFIPRQCVLSTKPGRSHPAAARTNCASNAKPGLLGYCSTASEFSFHLFLRIFHIKQSVLIPPPPPFFHFSLLHHHYKLHQIARISLGCLLQSPAVPPHGQIKPQ